MLCNVNEKYLTFETKLSGGLKSGYVAFDEQWALWKQQLQDTSKH